MAIEPEPRDLGHARFGCSDRRPGYRSRYCRNSQDRRSADSARRKIMRRAHQRRRRRWSPCGWKEITHHVADDSGRLLERRAGDRAANSRCPDDAAVHRLEPVARVRERADA